MFIPTYILWIIGIIIWIGFSLYIGRPRGNFDFVSPLIGFSIILIGLAFIIGLVL